VFRRALERGNLLVAEATAKEIGRLSLSEALELTLLIARKEPRRHPRGSRCSAERSFNRLLREGAGRKSRQKYGPNRLVEPRSLEDFDYREKYGAPAYP
jgi:hypothetical protein